MTLPARRPGIPREDLRHDDLHGADLHAPVLAPGEEAERLNALHELDILDSPAEEAFDRITRLTRKLFDVPVAIVSFVDAHRQWYKSSRGAQVTEVPREQSFCRYVIADGSPIVVTNATQDSRFARNPYVLTNPGVRFYAAFPLQTRKGHNVGTLCLVDVKPRVFDADQLEIMSDLAHMVMDELHLRMCAEKDALTDALSRRAFKESAARLAALAVRQERPLSVISFDLDFFKHTNDTFGHATGDRVLRDAVDVCARYLRTGDLIGRLGGEEFSIVLPNMDEARAVETAEQLRRAIETNEINLEGKPIKSTGSFGVAALSLVAGDIETLLDHADQALYRAKSEGRNRVALWRSGANDPAVARHRVLKAGQIVYDGRSSTIDCTVRWLSETGAGLAISTTVGLPKLFYLLILADGFDRPCRIVAQTARQIEVSFC
jgi:diguanylate cyclase (GGDEF)-like protein